MTRHGVKVGDAVDVHMLRLMGPPQRLDDPNLEESVAVVEAWIPGYVRRVDDATVTVTIPGEGVKVYPIESPNWRPAK